MIGPRSWLTRMAVCVQGRRLPWLRGWLPMNGVVSNLNFNTLDYLPPGRSTRWRLCSLWSWIGADFLDFQTSWFAGTDFPFLIPSFLDPKFVRNFLLTFKSFMTLQEFFDLLVERFWMQPPPNLGFGELEEWKKLKQYVVRMRCVFAFRHVCCEM